MRYSLLLAIFFLASLSTEGQTFLYLKKLGGKRSVKYYAYDEVKFQLKGDPYFTTGKIQGFGEDHFVVHDTEVYLEDIARFDIRDKNVTYFSFRSSPGKLMFAGFLLPLADFTNRTVVSGEEASVPHKSIWISSLALFSAGITLRLIAPKYFELGTKRKAVIVTKSDDPTPETSDDTQ